MSADLDELLDSGVQAVLILTPDHTHEEIAVAARGSHSDRSVTHGSSQPARTDSATDGGDA